MEKRFEPVISRDIGIGEVQITATPDLVRRETNIDQPTTTDIRHWLEENADEAVRAAVIWRLTHPIHQVGADDNRAWDGVVRLGLENFPAS
ncbi:MAG: hypothetical protein ACT6R2_07675 [Blastomonas fulva]